jgi:hypothetical protein
LTKVLQPNCSIHAPAKWTVDSLKDLNLIADIVNKDTVKYFYKWNCVNSTSAKQVQCPFNTNISSTPAFGVAKNSLVPSKDYTFTLSVLNSNNQTITTCGKTLTVASPCKPVNLTIAMKNNNMLNYHDVTVDQTFICNADSKKFGATSTSEYDWILTDSNSTVEVLSTFNSTKYRETGKFLTIFKNSLLANKNYTLTCTVSGLVSCG